MPREYIYFVTNEYQPLIQELDTSKDSDIPFRCCARKQSAAGSKGVSTEYWFAHRIFNNDTELQYITSRTRREVSNVHTVNRRSVKMKTSWHISTYNSSGNTWKCEVITIGFSHNSEMLPLQILCLVHRSVL